MVKLIVAVASKNPVKIAAAKGAFAKCFPDFELEVNTIDVPSGVSSQPMTDSETKQGAENRARGAQESFIDSDYFVGIEGGIEEDSEGKLVCFAWVVVFDKNLELKGTSRSATFELPEQVATHVRNGIELGVADDLVFKRENSKHQGGTVGLLTGSLIDRTAYYEHTMILALIPFFNRPLYTQT